MKLNSKFTLFQLTTVLVLATTTCVSAMDDWPHWRGPNWNDQSSETDLLETWPEGGPKQVWTNKSAGMGYAGFSVVGDKLFTMGLEENSEFALCLDALTGKEIWRTEIGQRYRNAWGDGPRSTPSVDGERVYFMGASGDLACIDVTDGKKVWAIKMQDFGGRIPQWGYAESPLVDGKLVVCTPGGPDTTIVAVDKETGKAAWKSEPITVELEDGSQSKPPSAHYSSVLPIEIDGKRQYVQLLVSAVVGLDGETGKTLWQVPFLGRTAVIPSPIFDNNRVYVTAGYGIGSKQIKLENGKSIEEWYTKAMQNHHGSVVKLGDHYYGSSDKAFVCQSAKDGSMVWADRSVRKGALTYADGLFYHLQESDGKVRLLKASAEGKIEVRGTFQLEPLSTQRSPRGMIWVHPVVANGKLYLRDQEIIHCYDIKE